MPCSSCFSLPILSWRGFYLGYEVHPHSVMGLGVDFIGPRGGTFGLLQAVLQESPCSHISSHTCACVCQRGTCWGQPQPPPIPTGAPLADTLKPISSSDSRPGLQTHGSFPRLCLWESLCHPSAPRQCSCRNPHSSKWCHHLLGLTDQSTAVPYSAVPPALALLSPMAPALASSPPPGPISPASSLASWGDF